MKLNHTHDPERRSWIESANNPDGDFPLQNLPFGVFEADGRARRGGVAIGDYVLDLEAALAAGLFRGNDADVARAAAQPDLQQFLELGSAGASALRARLFDLLAQGGHDCDATRACLVPLTAAKMQLPLSPTAFTDFCTSLHHIERMGRGRPSHPAWTRIPVAYNGRASSVRASGHPVRRPCGQLSAGVAQLRAEPMLDFELELGAWLSTGSELGEPISLTQAQESIFGYCLVNDWSARAMQFFEMALGPFLGKSFLTTISPWIVSAEALWPYRSPAPGRALGLPEVPEHLQDGVHAAHGSIAVQLEALLRTPAMRRDGAPAEVITHTNSEHLHWTFAQMICHQASGGGNLCSGDLVASGTVSGPCDSARACFAEISERGEHPLQLRNGESRCWLEDDDELMLRGRVQRDGIAALGFGECRGTILPAVCA